MRSLFAQGKAEAAFQIEKLCNPASQDDMTSTFCAVFSPCRYGRGGQPHLPTNLCRTFSRSFKVKSYPLPSASTVDGVLRIKANSQIAYGQLNLSLCTAQFHFEVPHATVLHRILQSFL